MGPSTISTVAVVSPGHMGGAIGAALASGGTRVVATTAQRAHCPVGGRIRAGATADPR